MPGWALIIRIAACALLAAFLLTPQSFAPLFAPLSQHGAPAIYDQGNMLTLALAQVGTVLCATAASAQSLRTIRQIPSDRHHLA